MQRITALGMMATFVFTAALAGCQSSASAKLESHLQSYQQLRGSDVVASTGGRDQLTWLADDTPLFADMGAAASQPSTQPAGQTAAAGKGQSDLPYTPWRYRYGPAYPNDFWRSVGRDAQELPAIVWDDAVATASNPWSVAGILAAGVAGIAINGTGVDETVAGRVNQADHHLSNAWDSVGDVGGNPGTHFAIAGAFYVASLATGDNKTYENSKTMISALALNGLVTMGLKVATRTSSPNGDEFGWPSGHTSSTFTVATVLWHQYGPLAGVPAMAFAGFVGYERIDAGNHDFSDVVSGALIGVAIGHAVAVNHQLRIADMDIVPYVDPRGGAGLALTKNW